MSMVIRCPKRSEIVIIGDDKICSVSEDCDGILDTEGIEYIREQSKNLPPDLLGPIRINTGERRCIYKRYDD